MSAARHWGTQFSVVGAGSIVGMVLGGFLVSTLGWRSVFLINLPVGVLALTAAILVLDKSRSFKIGREANDPGSTGWGRS